MRRDAWRRDASYHTHILEGLTEGFSLVTPSDIIIPQYDAHNYGSAEQDSSKSLLDKLFEAEIQEGKISRVMENPHCIHAIGAVPKKSGADALRPITDCSRPFDSCLNSHMDYPKQKFKSIDDVCDLMSPGCYFASVDISRAYGAVPVLPGHRRYQGFRWMFGRLDREKYDYFIDNFLVFGLSCAPGIFARISNVICRMMGRRGYYNIVNYLDDYCVVSADREECSRAQLTLIHLLITLGFGVSWSKVCGPSQELAFLGITLDSTVMEARLPPDKLRKLRNILVDFTDRNRATKKELSSLAGILSFCSSVVKGGRCFSRRIIDLMNTVRHNHHYIRLNREFSMDIAFWMDWASTFNGKAKLIIGKPMPISSCQSDACLAGFGVYFDGLWICGGWDSGCVPLVPDDVDIHHNWTIEQIPEDLQRNINYLELYPVLLAARRWCHMWRDTHIILYTDNTSSMSFVNKGTCRSPSAMVWLRELALLAMTFNFHITARHLRGVHNVIADSLSRLSESGQWGRLLDYMNTNDLPLFLSHRETSHE